MSTGFRSWSSRPRYTWVLNGLNSVHTDWSAFKHYNYVDPKQFANSSKYSQNCNTCLADDGSKLSSHALCPPCTSMRFTVTRRAFKVILRVWNPHLDARYHGNKIYYIDQSLILDEIHTKWMSCSMYHETISRQEQWCHDVMWACCHGCGHVEIHTWQTGTHARMHAHMSATPTKLTKHYTDRHTGHNVSQLKQFRWTTV